MTKRLETVASALRYAPFLEPDTLNADRSESDGTWRH
jgi:hypothetical protein